MTIQQSTSVGYFSNLFTYKEVPTPMEVETVEEVTAPVVTQTVEEKLDGLHQRLVKETSDANEVAREYSALQKAELLRAEALIEKKAQIQLAAEALRVAKARSEAKLTQLSQTLQYGAVIESNVEDFMSSIEEEFGF
jgi:hypothetical protein